MNCLITGFPGTGKSAIAVELKKRGHIAYDPQSMRTYMHVEDRITGKHIKPPEQVPSGWYDTEAAYNWDMVKLQKLLSSDEDVYICSKAHNQSHFYDQFDKIFLLTLDFTLLLQRLENRPGRSIGKTPAEASDILERRDHFEHSLIEHNAIPIDVAHSIESVVNEILKLAYN